MRVLFFISCLVFALGLQSCKKEGTASEKLDSLQIEYFYQDADTIGGTVTIVGKGFSLDPAKNNVLFNSTPAKAFYSSHDTILVKVPSGAITGKFQVEVYSQTALSNGIFKVVTGRWKNISGFPGTARTGAVGFSIGDKGYITLGLGAAGNEYKYLWEINTLTNTWTKKADFPGIDRISAFSFVINNRAYVGGGSTIGTERTNDFYEYDPQLNSWSIKTPNPTYVGFLTNALGFSINGKGYVVSQSFVHEYNPHTDQWIRKADFPGQSSGHSAGFVIGSKGYIVGGYGSNNPVKECWEYNSATDEWVQKTSFPTTIFDPVGFSINGNGYVGNGGTQTRMLWKYDTKDDKWEQKTNVPGYPTAQNTSFVVGDKGYILVAYYQNSLTNEIWQFDPFN